MAHRGNGRGHEGATTAHVPVLFQQTLDGLGLEPGMTVVDATFGGGGHAREIAKRIGRKGRLIAMDADAEAFRRTDLSGYAAPTTPIVANFRAIASVLESEGIDSIDAALFDLGVSSFTLETSGRGFSFMKDEPLLMTYDERGGDVTAERVLNDWSEGTLADVIYAFGEERAAKRIARAIVNERERSPITTTARLADIVSKVVRRRGKIHPATKTFQAIRMAVNDELGAIEKGIRGAIDRLRAGGRLAVISFHSVDDRKVKHLLKDEERSGRIVLVSKKAIVPSREETLENPRSRSAKLRIAVRSTQ